MALPRRYFHLSVEQFEQSFNPGNAELVIMERRADKTTGEEWYVLNGECAAALNMGKLDHTPINSNKQDHTPINSNKSGCKEDGTLPLGGSFVSLQASFTAGDLAGIHQEGQPGKGHGGLC